MKKIIKRTLLIFLAGFILANIAADIYLLRQDTMFYNITNYNSNPGAANPARGRVFAYDKENNAYITGKTRFVPPFRYDAKTNTYSTFGALDSIDTDTLADQREIPAFFYIFMLKYSIFLSLFHTEKDMDLVSILKREGTSLTSYVKVGNHEWVTYDAKLTWDMRFHTYLVQLDNTYFAYHPEQMALPYLLFLASLLLFISAMLYYLVCFKRSKLTIASIQKPLKTLLCHMPIGLGIVLLCGVIHFVLHPPASDVNDFEVGLYHEIAAGQILLTLWYAFMANKFEDRTSKIKLPNKLKCVLKWFFLILTFAGINYFIFHAEINGLVDGFVTDALGMYRLRGYINSISVYVLNESHLYWYFIAPCIFLSFIYSVINLLFMNPRRAFAVGSVMGVCSVFMWCLYASSYIQTLLAEIFYTLDWK